jgi:hypothetical protein
MRKCRYFTYSSTVVTTKNWHTITCVLMIWTSPYVFHPLREKGTFETCQKNGETQIVHLRRHVSYYRVIRDARPGASPITIYVRRATSERVTYLISAWDPYATNLRRVLRVCVSYF